MARLRLEEIALRTGGTRVEGAPGLAFCAFGIDSRRTVAGELFFAIVGERDGHDFVPAAAAAGAAGAVVSRTLTAALPPGFGLIEVRDTVSALHELARSVIGGSRAKVVGITGSIGKTTTKEFAAALLSARLKVMKSGGNFNNHLGLALSVLTIEPEDEAAVLEMGMSAPGEIRTLTKIAPPDVAVITNINPVHLQFFRSMEEIALAKLEILEGAKDAATAVLNGDDPLVKAVANGWPGRRITFGFSPAAEVRAEDVRHRGYEGVSFTLCYGEKKDRVEFPFVNEAYICNLLAAAAVARAFGLELDEIAPAIAALKPFAMRGVLAELPGGIRLYDDSYNSSPRALESALKSLAALPARRRVAVLADMLELGEREIELHERAGEIVARLGWDVLVTVGPLAAWIASGAAAAGMRRSDIHSFPDSDAAGGAVAALLREGDLVLVKGSRGMKTEKIIDRLRAKGKD